MSARMGLFMQRKRAMKDQRGPKSGYGNGMYSWIGEMGF